MERGKQKRKDAEEEQLESIVLGAQSRFFQLASGYDVAADSDASLSKKRRAADELDDGCVISIDRRGGDNDHQPLTAADGRLEPAQSPPNSADGASAAGSEASDDDGSGSGADAGDCDAAAAVAWHDEDDRLVTVGEAAAALSGDAAYRPSLPAIACYGATLRQRFTSVYGEPEWARVATQSSRPNVDSDGESDAGVDEDEQRVLASSGRLLAADSERLPAHTLDYKRCGDLSSSVGVRLTNRVTALQFHPGARVAVVAGGAQKQLSIVQVDGDDNPLIQHVALPSDGGAKSGGGARWACFSHDGSWLFSGSPLSPQLFCYDMMSGGSRHLSLQRQLRVRSLPPLLVSPDARLLAVLAPRAGAVHLLTAGTQQLVDSLQLGCRPAAAAFSPDGRRLWVHTEQAGSGGGGAGHVFEWDVASRRCVHRFVDEGCLSGTAVAASHDGRLLACGSSVGIVNVYSTADVGGSSAPRPLKALPQLTTACTQLQFNANSEILAMSSSEKENALRLVHVRSRTVFANFPGWIKSVRRPYTVDFSQNSGFLAVGTSNSRALLFRLKQYHNF